MHGEIFLKDQASALKRICNNLIYTQDLDVFSESLNRLSVYDIKANELIYSLEIAEYGDYFSKKYYQNKDKSIFQKLSDKWDVEYFIWDKKYDVPEVLKVVFETNEHFILEIKNSKLSFDYY